MDIRLDSIDYVKCYKNMLQLTPKRREFDFANPTT